jgi:hypothetical protein
LISLSLRLIHTAKLFQVPSFLEDVIDGGREEQHAPDEETLAE